MNLLNTRFIVDHSSHFREKMEWRLYIYAMFLKSSMANFTLIETYLVQELRLEERKLLTRVRGPCLASYHHHDDRGRPRKKSWALRIALKPDVLRVISEQVHIWLTRGVYVYLAVGPCDQTVLLLLRGQKHWIVHWRSSITVATVPPWNMWYRRGGFWGALSSAWETTGEVPWFMGTSPRRC